MTNEEFKKGLEERTLVFTVAAMDFLYRLPRHPLCAVIITQLAKSSSSMGANYREANRAESRPDFVHKIGVVEKESSETVYWLTVLSRVSFIEEQLKLELAALSDEATQLLKLFSTIKRKCSSGVLKF
jgi:four helix bundle protein